MVGQNASTHAASLTGGFAATGNFPGVPTKI